MKNIHKKNLIWKVIIVVSENQLNKIANWSKKKRKKKSFFQVKMNEES